MDKYGIIHRSDAEDETVSSAATSAAEELVPALTNAEFQHDIVRILIGIFASHFQQVRNNVARALHDKDLKIEDLQLRIGVLEENLRQLKERRNKSVTSTVSPDGSQPS